MAPTTAPPMTKPLIHSTTNQTTPTRSLLMPRDSGTAPSLLECCATARGRRVVVRDGDTEAGDPIQYDELRIARPGRRGDRRLQPRHPPVHDRRRGGEADSPGKQHRPNVGRPASPPSEDEHGDESVVGQARRDVPAWHEDVESARMVNGIPRCVCKEAQGEKPWAEPEAGDAEDDEDRRNTRLKGKLARALAC